MHKQFRGQQLSHLLAHGSKFDYFLIRAGEAPQGFIISDPVLAEAFREARYSALTATDPLDIPGMPSIFDLLLKPSSSCLQ